MWQDVRFGRRAAAVQAGRAHARLLHPPLGVQAMGENLHDEVAGEAEDSRARRLKLIAAVEGDNWSEVIEGQTAETVVSAGGRCRWCLLQCVGCCQQAGSLE